MQLTLGYRLSKTLFFCIRDWRPIEWIYFGTFWFGLYKREAGGRAESNAVVMGVVLLVLWCGTMRMHFGDDEEEPLFVATKDLWYVTHTKNVSHDLVV
jgi:hypothetical protein